MLTKSKFKNWEILSTNRDGNVRILFENYLAGTLEKIVPAEKITQLKLSDKIRVLKIDFGGNEYVLKHVYNFRHKLEVAFKSFFFGTNTARLIRTLENAREKNPADVAAIADHFLVADLKKYRCLRETVIVMEFVGNAKAVAEIPAGTQIYGNAVADVVLKMHKIGLIHGDAHAGNFLVDARGNVRVIDIEGRRATPVQKGYDRLLLEKNFGIKNLPHDWGYFYAKIRQKYHALSKFLKGRRKRK